ncbi:MAG: single-stranded-DNA-specific exonuclease RecJ, partial [Opitutaceae bacterium]|nr:single-stranded-DNA-specific exonuclease RecJ [Opitutaceae bacterium]
MRWNYTPVDTDQTAALARSLDTAPIVAELLLRNALSSPDAAARFLAPALASLGDPFLLGNLTEAVERLLLARRLQQSVVVLGDYDVDGV